MFYLLTKMRPVTKYLEHFIVMSFFFVFYQLLTFSVGQFQIMAFIKYLTTLYLVHNNCTGSERVFCTLYNRYRN